MPFSSLSSNLKISDKFLSNLFNVARLLLVIYIAYLAAQISIRLFFAKTAVPATSIHKIATRKQAIDITQLQHLNLFGTETVSTNADNAPVTHLQLQLTGVFQAKIPTASFAIIAEAGSDGQLYHVGESLPGGATLDQVFSDKVMIKRNGQLETLAFEKTENLLSAPDENLPDQNLTGAPLKQLLSDAKENHSTITPKDLLQAFDQGMQKNPADVFAATGLRAMPIKQGGGYLVSAGAPDAFIQSSGLQRGDIIRKVNGHLLGDILADQQLLKNILAQSSAQVELERDSRQFTMTVNLPR